MSADRVAALVGDLHRAERALHRDLLDVAARHGDEPEIAHVTRLVAEWSAEHADALTAVATRLGLDLGPGPADAPDDRPDDPGLALISDLRGLHRDAAAVVLDWTLLSQVAQTRRDTELSELVARCRAESVRQRDWAVSQLSTSAPQVFAS